MGYGFVGEPLDGLSPRKVRLGIDKERKPQRAQRNTEETRTHFEGFLRQRPSGQKANVIDGD